MCGIIGILLANEKEFVSFTPTSKTVFFYCYRWCWVVGSLSLSLD